MLNIIYKEIDCKIEEKIKDKYGSWVIDYRCLHYGDGCYSLAAVLDNEPIGFISVYERYYPEPLSNGSEVYIDVIEVHKDFQGFGIASKLLRLTENWAKDHGYHQISAWSSDDKKQAIQMWYALDYCVSPAVMRGESVITEFAKKPIYGFYVTKLLNPFEKYPHIIEAVKNDIDYALPEASLYQCRLIREKNGVYVYRGKLNNQSVVIKYFQKEEDKREIDNYRLLNNLHIPTMTVLAYGTSCIVLEDIEHSDQWRLGKEEDLEKEEVALHLARWYFDFHEKGLLYEALDQMYHETDALTEANLNILREKLPEAKETFDYIIQHIDALIRCIKNISQTFNYNDFYWTNLLVSRDETKAMPFDYNLLGAGFRYNDLRNVTSSLSNEASEVFHREYNRLYQEKYDNSREKEEEKEKQVDRVTSSLFSLISAYEHRDFPTWAIPDKNATLNGDLLKDAKDLLEQVMYCTK
ncbi:MAG: hypothetical protein K0S47_1291 [Herbinix sp.]|jgi:GNAT superfamily N-acetyltransferase|nr:hypothetical protein [Herbinix sp.]